jgi:hypothetical protein
MLTLLATVFGDPTAIIWGDVATWVQGIATVLLFVVGFLQINNERNQRIKRDKDVELQKRRAQAELISAWIVKEDQEVVHDESVNAGEPRPRQWVAVLNQSSQPVYQVVVSLVALAPSGQTRGGPASQDDQSLIALAPPGIGYTAVHALYGGMHRRPGIVIAFRDAAGNNWIRTALGELSELDKPSEVYYKGEFPASFGLLYPEIPLEIVL